ncbi:GTP pyrophosphokinase [Patescibacteria group bacterium]|nr:GTP pyrophosphokinase [Patescibacteria group bacterium]
MSVEKLVGLEKKAMDISTRAHFEQVDKVGKDYVPHPIRVSEMGKNENERIVGLLHDVVEDSDVTLENLWNEGFSVEVIAAIDSLTKRVGEAYHEYIIRVKENELARTVKLYDIEDSLDPFRLKNASVEDRIRLTEKYKAARMYLEI